MLNDSFRHIKCTFKMHVRTYKLAKFSGVVSTFPDSIGRERERGKGRVGEKKRRGKGKEKAEGMTEGRGRKEGMGNSDGGNCATAPRGRHWSSPLQFLALA